MDAITRCGSKKRYVKIAMNILKISQSINLVCEEGATDSYVSVRLYVRLIIH